MRHVSLAFSAAGLTLALAACAGTSNRDPSPSVAQQPSAAARSTVSSAQAVLSAASGSLVSGKLSARATDNGIRLTGEVGGLPANSSHGFHIHERGDCSAADASSAGGHFNPAAQPHGRSGHGDYHGGDADNIVADANGVAKVDRFFPGLVLGGGSANDALGKAVIVHAKPDDYTSQPSGNAGDRVACGVIR